MLLVFCAALALTVGVSAAGAKDRSKKKCGHGAWQTVYRADGSSFKNEDTCIDYLRAGGTLSSGNADVSLSYAAGPPRSLNVYATNAGPSTVTVSVDFQWQGTGCDATAAVSGPVTLTPGQSVSVWQVGWSNCDSSPIVAYAQVTSASVHDPDSTPNNYTNGFTGPAVEDDEVFVQFGPEGP